MEIERLERMSSKIAQPENIKPHLGLPLEVEVPQPKGPVGSIRALLFFESFLVLGEVGIWALLHLDLG
jgi:hypothetical protein